MIFKTFPILERFYFENSKLTLSLVLGPRKRKKSEFSILPAVLSSLLQAIGFTSPAPVLSWHFTPSFSAVLTPSCLSYEYPAYCVCVCIFISLVCDSYVMRLSYAWDATQYALHMLLSLIIAMFHRWKTVTWLKPQSWYRVKEFKTHSMGNSPIQLTLGYRPWCTSGIFCSLNVSIFHNLDIQQTLQNEADSQFRSFCRIMTYISVARLVGTMKSLLSLVIFLLLEIMVF